MIIFFNLLNEANGTWNGLLIERFVLNIPFAIAAIVFLNFLMLVYFYF